MRRVPGSVWLLLLSGVVAACGKPFEAPPAVQTTPWYRDRWIADPSILEAYSVTVLPACAEALYLRYERRSTGYMAIVDSRNFPGYPHRSQWVRPRHATGPLTSEQTHRLEAALETGHFWDLPASGGLGTSLDGERVYLEGYRAGGNSIFSHLTNPDSNQAWLVDELVRQAPVSIHEPGC